MSLQQLLDKKSSEVENYRKLKFDLAVEKRLGKINSQTYRIKFGIIKANYEKEIKKINSEILLLKKKG